MKKTNKYAVFLVALIVVYVGLYFVYIYPLSRLHQLQSKEWATTLIENTVLGVKDFTYLYKINQSKIDTISCHYNFFVIHTQKYTMYVMFHVHNKYSTKATVSVYWYNFETKTTELHQVVLDYNDLQTSKHGDTLRITCGDFYRQELNLVANNMTLEVQMSSLHLALEFDIEDYTSIMPTFLPRYDNLKDIVRPYSPQTTTPGEWVTYNPMMGKIINGSINQDPIEGTFWHENVLGVNDFFISSNIWYFVLTDDWSIYKLWYGTQEDDNKTCFFIVKHRKTNQVIRSGVFGGRGYPSPFKPLDNMINPVKCTCTSTKLYGTLNYDQFSSSLETNEISVHFESIPNECHRTLLYDYYDSGEPVENKNFEIVNNYQYAEYVNLIRVEITYQGKKEQFEARCCIDTVYKKDKTLPDSF